MSNFKHILFPIDFSDQNRAMAAYVSSMASRYGSRLTLLHVREVPARPAPGWPMPGAQEAIEALADEARRHVDSFLSSEFQNVDVSRRMLNGDPATVIVDYIAQNGVDLVMLPTHGYGPFRRFLLGSVTAKVLHDAICPVWTSSHLPAIATPPAAYRNVLCALDLKQDSLTVLRWALEFARENDATLTLTHAMPGAKPAGIDIEGARYRAALFDMASDAFANLQREAGSDCKTVLEADDVAPGIQAAAEANQADLIVIGHGGRHAPLGRLRSHVYFIVREAPCPVICV
jgi:nucleotide-binding universal stress UspA family protein